MPPFQATKLQTCPRDLLFKFFDCLGLDFGGDSARVLFHALKKNRRLSAVLRDYMLMRRETVKLTGTWSGKRLAGLCRAMPNIMELVPKSEDLPPVQRGLVWASSICCVLACQRLTSLDLGWTEQRGAVWPQPGQAVLPTGLVRLGMPPFDVPNAVHDQLDCMTQLTRLDCAGTGYLPSTSLIALKHLTVNGERTLHSGGNKFGHRLKSFRDQFLSDGLLPLSSGTGHLRKLSALTRLTFLDIRQKVAGELGVVHAPPSLVELKVKGGIHYEALQDLVAGLLALASLQLMSGPMNFLLRSESLRFLALLDMPTNLDSIQLLDNLERLVIRGNNVPHIQEETVAHSLGGIWHLVMEDGLMKNFERQGDLDD